MSTHNISFHWEIRMLSAFFEWKKRLICCYEKKNVNSLKSSFNRKIEQSSDYQGLSVTYEEMNFMTNVCIGKCIHKQQWLPLSIMYNSRKQTHTDSLSRYAQEVSYLTPSSCQTVTEWTRTPSWESEKLLLPLGILPVTNRGIQVILNIMLILFLRART